MTGGQARSDRAAGAYLGQTKENMLGKSGSGLDVKQMAYTQRDSLGWTEQMSWALGNTQ